MNRFYGINYKFASQEKKLIKMRKTIITLSAVLLTTITFGQKLKLTEAAVAYQDLKPMWFMQPDLLEASKSALVKAKSAIDIAYTEQEEKKSLKPKDEGKLNYYRGVIYLDYTFLSAMDKEIMKEVEANQETFADIPFSSLKKCKELTGYYDDDIATKMNFLRGISIQGGVQMFEEKKYEEAFAAFSGAVQMSEIVDYKDTLAMFNAGLAADQIDNYDDAIKYYLMAAEANYLGNAEVYRNIIQVVNRKNNGPSDESLKYIELAKAKYPGDINIIIEEFNYHNSKGNPDAAQASLQKAIEKDPKNPIFHYSIGATFDELANKRHEEGKHDEARTYVVKAVEAYNKVIELDPKFADAYYNMGVLYNNESYNLTNEIKSIEDVKLQDEKLKESREYLRKAIPFLEKSHELTPTDVNTLKLLKSIYFTIEDEDNYSKIAAKLKELGQ